MRKQWRLVNMAFRAALWRATPDPQPASFVSLLGCIIVALCAEGAMQYLEAAAPARFNPYGLNATIAWCSIGLVVTGLFVWPGARLTFLAGSVLLAVFVNLLRIAGALALPSEFWTTHKIGLWTNNDTAVLFFLLQLVGVRGELCDPAQHRRDRPQEAFQSCCCPLCGDALAVVSGAVRSGIQGTRLRSAFGKLLGIHTGATPWRLR
jgi:hypothetical protein